ncbi:hypothetical protein [Geodermatophilus sp. URMC 62]|uniref:hypothetical protein n=1 Tax=Geodermatophilus sp. URMC 62 TaxID=3423414 RepID=UPI00406CE0AC
MEMELELVPIPVTDVDRAKAFSVDRLGFVEDVDVRPAEGVRVVQLTPPGSACSIGLGTGLPAYDDAPPGSVEALHPVVADIERARAELVGAASAWASWRTSVAASSTPGSPTPTGTP